VLSSLSKTEDGQKGMTMRVYLEPASNTNRTPIDTVYLDNTEMHLSDYKHPKLTSHTWYTEVTGLLTPDESGEYIFSLSVAGTAMLYIDGKLVVDNANDQRAGDSFFGAGTDERTGTVDLEAGKTYTILVQHGTLPTSPLRNPGATAIGAGGLRIGGMKKIDDQIELEKAVELAKTVDQVVICAGLNVSLTVFYNPTINPIPP
jgi:beta-glucosidase